MARYARKQRPSKSTTKFRSRIKFVFVALCAVVLVGGTTLLAQRFPAASAAPQSDGISAEALAQIEALIREKESRSPTERKLDSQLIYELKMDRGENIANGIRSLETDVPVTVTGRTEVDITANVSDVLLDQLRSHGVEIVNTVVEESSIRARVDLDQLETIAALPDIKFIQPKQDAMTSSTRPRVSASDDGTDMPSMRPAFNDRVARVRTLLSSALQGEATGNSIPASIPPTGQGSRTSQGDATHRAFAARGTFHVDGTGVKIGVLSDGVANLAASQALGDLGPVTVLPGQTGTGDEGTAMLEIVHDLAPGAQLYFATAFTSITSFADNIRALRAAGCDIIIDDVFYFVESPFQDGQLVPTNTNGGVVTQAVNDVTADGALYFSSAGNEGNVTDGTAGVWEGNFADGGPTTLGVGRVHSFGLTNFNTLIANGLTICLFWSDPLGGSNNDYDLFRLNAAGTAVAAGSTNPQNGTQDPFERIASNTANPRIVIVKRTGAADRFLHLNTFRGRLAIATIGQTHGHSAAAEAFSVAASPAVGPFPNPFSEANVSEAFTSDGPRRLFFQPSGAPFTTDLLASGGIVRQKPDITAADGVAVTGVGGFSNPFFGTSAAAPHAGAIAALLKSADPTLTPAQVRTILTTSAVDIETPGVDRNTGAGIVMAYNALQAAGIEGTANVQFGSVTADEDPGNSDGAINAGEGARLNIQLTNLGVNAATNVTATLTTSTAGVTIQMPNASPYQDLAAINGAGFNLSPFRFTVASDAACPLIANFVLSVSYAGGPSPKVLTFSVALGPTENINSTLNTTAPMLPAGFSSAITGTQTGRLNRNAQPSSCGVQKPNPGIFNPPPTGVRRFDAYTFTACADSCITMRLNTGNSNLFPVIYLGNFDPANLTANYHADPGSSGSGMPFSFNITSGQTYTIVVHEVDPGGGNGNNYNINIFGCMVNCVAVNRVPTAKAKNVTVPAGPDCNANASVDDGSFDADGDPLTITQSPAGPYPVGTTNVLLTVTDPSGATSQAMATVTVVDGSGPEVIGASVSRESIWPANHQMVPVAVSYSASDTCSSANCVLSVSSNEPVNGTGDGDAAPDWIIVDNRNVLLRAERSGKGIGRVYTIRIDCTDATGNHSVKTVAVKVPKSQGY